MTSIASTSSSAPLAGNGGPPNATLVYSRFGESLSDIADRTGFDLHDLQQANPHVSADQPLLAGEPIHLPGWKEPSDGSSLAANLGAGAGIYKHTDAAGKVTYSDRPVTEPGTAEVLRSDGTRKEKPREDDDKAKQFSEARSLIKAAQKHGGKINDYIQELDYLRTHNPVKLDAALKELRESDPKLWLELQKHPQFRPLVESLSFNKNSTRYLEAGVEAVGTLATKGAVSVPVAVAPKLGESTVKDLMKRDRYPGSSDVLGSKASTLPEPPKPTYSNTKLGEWRKAEDTRLATAGKEAAKDMSAAAQGTRAASAAALSRVLGPLLDVGIGALNPEVASGISAIRGMQIARKLEDKGILDGVESLQLRGLMAAGKYDEARQMIEAGLARKAAQQ